MLVNLKFYTKNFLINFIFCLFGFMLCLLLFLKGIHPILASSITGLIGSFLPPSKYYNIESSKACIYAASFCAIGAHLICHNSLQYIALLSILSFVFSTSKNIFIGFGGKLGTIAFTATGIFLLLKELF